MKIELHPNMMLCLFFVGLVVPVFIFGIPLTMTQIEPIPASPLIIPFHEQVLLFSTAFIVKPLYMALSLLIVFLLRGNTEGELVAIRRGMLLFFLGELACALNYLVFRDNSPLFEYWHNYGMVSAFVLFSFALVVVLDERIVHYSNPSKRCALFTLCGGCYKQSAMRCTLLTLFLYVLPALSVLAAMPLAASLENRFMVGTVLGESVRFGHPIISQIIEARFFPVVAVCFLSITAALLLIKQEQGFSSSKILIALGLGPFIFSLMRFVCYWGYAGNPLWADVWEELSEFMFVLFILRIVFMVRSRRPKAVEA